MDPGRLHAVAMRAVIKSEMIDFFIMFLLLINSLMRDEDEVNGVDGFLLENVP
jgi:hypothetical protein